MSWEDIESDESFQALPEEERADIRKNYFDREIAPHVPAAEMEVVRSNFFGRPKSDEFKPETMGVIRTMGKLLWESAKVAKEASFLGAEPESAKTPETAEAPKAKEDPLDRITRATADVAKRATAWETMQSVMEQSLPTFSKAAKWAERQKLGGLGDRVGNTLASGVAQSIQNKLRIPALAVDVVNLPRNIRMWAEGRPEMMVEAPEEWVDNEATRYWGDLAKRTAARVPRLSDSEYDLAMKGDWEGAGKALAYHVLQNAPQQAEMVAGMLTGLGAPALLQMGLQSGADTMSRGRERGVGVILRTAGALVSAGAEIFFETAGTWSAISRLSKEYAKAVGTHNAWEIAKSAVKTIAAAGAWEGFEEVPTTAYQAMAEYFTGIDPHALDGIEGKLANSQFRGMGAGSTMTAGGAMISGAQIRAEVNRGLEDQKNLTVMRNTVRSLGKMREVMGDEATPEAMSEAGAAMSAESRKILDQVLDHKFAEMRGEVPPRKFGAFAPPATDAVDEQWSTEPQDVAKWVDAVGVLGKDVGESARLYPFLMQTAISKSKFNWAMQAVGPAYEPVLKQLVAAGVEKGPLLDMLVTGIKSGKANRLNLSQLDDAIFQAILIQNGARVDTIPMHQEAARAAASRPAETLVTLLAEKIDTEEHGKALARANQMVQEEAMRARRGAETPTGAPEAQEPSKAPRTGAEAAQEALLVPHERPLPLPPKGPALQEAIEAGVPHEEAAVLHREKALEEQDKGTLEPEVAAAYAEEGDASFDPLALEQESHAVPPPEEHPGSLEWEAFLKKFNLEPTDELRATHEGLVLEYQQDQDAVKAREAATKEAQAPVEELRKKSPLELTEAEFYRLYPGSVEGAFQRWKMRIADEYRDQQEEEYREALDAEERKGKRREAEKDLRAGRSATLLSEKAAKYGADVMALPGLAPTSEAGAAPTPAEPSEPRVVSPTPEPAGPETVSAETLRVEGPFRRAYPYAHIINGKPFIVKTQGDDIALHDALAMGEDPSDVAFRKARSLYYHDHAHDVLSDIIKKKGEGKDVSAEESRFKDSLYKHFMLEGRELRGDDIPEWVRDARGAAILREPVAAYKTAAPAFYSKLQRDIEARLPEKATVEQVRAILRDQKQEEVSYSGIEDFLDKKTSVSKKEVLDFLRAQAMQEGFSLFEPKSRYEAAGEYVRGMLAEPSDFSDDLILRIRSVMSKSAMDGLRRHAEALSNLLQSPSLLTKSQGMSDAPSSVVDHVLGVCGNADVRRAIIGAIPIDVMNLLSAAKLSPEHLLSDKAMLKDMLASDTKTPVSPGINVSNGTLPLVRVVAKAATEISSLAGWPFISASASPASAKNPIFGAHNIHDITKTSAFSRWFGDSKVVDEGGEPLVVYHSTKNTRAPGGHLEAFKRKLSDVGIHFGTLGQAEDRRLFLRGGLRPGDAPPDDTGSRIIPVYLSIKNPLRLGDAGSWNAENLSTQLHADSYVFDWKEIKDAMDSSRNANGKLVALRKLIESKGYDGIVYQNTGEVEGGHKLREEMERRRALMFKKTGWPSDKHSFSEEEQEDSNYQYWREAVDAEQEFREESGVDSWIAFHPEQIKSAIGNRGTFDPKDPSILHDIAAVQMELDLAYGPGADIPAIVKKAADDIAAGKPKSFTGIAEILRKEGRAALRGIKVPDLESTEEAIRFIRNPELEILAVRFTRAGKTLYTALWQGGVNSLNISAAMRADILDMAHRLGAESLEVIHNHPSGNHVLSDDDTDMAAVMQKEWGTLFGGLIATDDTAFSITMGMGRQDKAVYEYSKPMERFAQRPTGAMIHNPEAAARVVADLKHGKPGHVVLYLDNSGGLISTSIHDEASGPYMPALSMFGIQNNPRVANALVVATTGAPLIEYKGEFPLQVRHVFTINSKGEIVDPGWVRPENRYAALPGQLGEESAYRTERLAAPLPPYMGGPGISAADFAAVVKERGIKAGSPLTARVNFSGIKKGEAGKVLGLDMGGPSILAEFGGQVLAVAPENIVETYVRPQDRAIQKAVSAATAATGKPSVPVKDIVKGQQAGLASAEVILTAKEALKLRLRSQAFGARRGARDAKRKARHAIEEAFQQEKWEAATRKQVADYVEEYLPATERYAFIDRILKANTHQKLLHVFWEIQAKAEQVHKRSLLNDIKTLVYRVLKSPSFPVGFKRRIEERMEGLRLENWNPDTKEKIRADEEFLRQMERSGEDIVAPAALLERIDKLSDKPLAEMPVSELEKLLEDLESLAAAGREVRAMSLALEEARRQQDILELAGPGGVKGIRSQRKERGYRSLAGEPDISWLKKFKNWWLSSLDLKQRVRMVTTPIMHMVETIDGRESGPTTRIILNPMQDCYARYLVDLYELFQKERDTVMARWGFITKAEREKVGVALISEEEGGRERLHNRPELDDIRIDAFIAEVRASPRLSEMKAWCQKMIQLKTEEMVRVAAKVENLDIKLVENYYTYLRDWKAEEEVNPASIIDPKKDSVSYGYRRKTDEGFLERRVKESKQIIKIDPFEVLDVHIPKKLWFIHMAGELKRAGALVNSEEYKAAAGDMGSRLMSEWLDAMARMGGSEGARRMHRLGTMRRNFSLAQMGANPGTILVQPSSLGDGAAAIGGKHMARGLDMRFDPEWQAIFDDLSPKLKYRGEGRNLYSEPGFAHMKNRLEHYGFAPVKWGDDMAAHVIFGGAYALYHDLHKIKLDKSKPNKDAARFAQSIVDKTQSSPHLIDMPLMVSGGRLTGFIDLDRSLAQFQLFAMSRYSHIADDILGKEWKKGNRMEAMTRLSWIMGAIIYESGMRAGLAGLAVAAASLTGAGDERKKEKETFMWQVARNTLGVIPIVPNMIQSILWDQDIIPSMSAPRRMVKAGAEVAGGVAGGKPMMFWRGVVDALTSAGALAGVAGSGVAGRMIRRQIPNDEREGSSSRRGRPSRPSRPSRPRRQ